MQDIIPPEKRSIRNVPLQPKSSWSGGNPPVQNTIKKEDPQPAVTDPVYHFEDVPTRAQEDMPVAPRSTGVFKKILIAVAVVLAIIVVFAGYTFFYSNAQLTITPKTQNISVNFILDTVSSATASGTPVFTVLTRNTSTSTTIASIGQETVSLKATGVITISNAYSKNSQRLVATTRFQTPDGKIYRAVSAITVPGERTVLGKVVPGTVDATVAADLPGSTYNISSSTFTIPGFSGTPQYQGFSAVVKTAIQGGFSGTRQKVSLSDLQTAETNLNASLMSSVGKTASSDDTMTTIANYTYVASATVDQTVSPVLVTMTATQYSIDLPEKDLSDQVVNAAGLANSQVAIFVNDFSSLKFIQTDAIQEPWTASELHFDVSGTAKAIWYYDPDLLKKDLAGTSKKDMSAVLSKYPGITKAEAVVSPFWKTSFPGNPDKISIIETSN